MPRKKRGLTLDLEFATAVEEERSRRRVAHAAKNLRNLPILANQGRGEPTLCDERCTQPGSAGYFQHRRRNENACDDALRNWAKLISSYRKKAR